MNPKSNDIKLSGVVFFAGLAILLVAVLVELPFGFTPSGIGQDIIAESPGRTGAANTVTSVVLGYRGLDTLGELIILFTAATAAGMVLGKARRESYQEQQQSQQSEAGFILRTAADVIYPFLMLLGAYIIVHGHLSPGGGFQGGAILAVAFFLPLLARPATPFAETVFSAVETLAGSVFIVIGLFALLSTGHFLEPLLGTGTPGELFSAGTLPLLYLAVGLKVGTELAGMLARLMQTEGSSG
jgi:multicomponent Na+:H+ antiporter subunit B